MKKTDFRIIKKTTRGGDMTFYLQIRYLLFFWCYVKSSMGLKEIYKSRELAMESVIRRVTSYNNDVNEMRDKEVNKKEIIKIYCDKDC